MCVRLWNFQSGYVVDVAGSGIFTFLYFCMFERGFKKKEETWVNVTAILIAIISQEKISLMRIPGASSSNYLFTPSSICHLIISPKLSLIV